MFCNHKDGDKSNNCIENLEWCTLSENAIHSYKVLGNYGPWKGVLPKDNPLSKEVERKDRNGAVTTYPSAREAGKENNLDHSGIAKTCRGGYKTYGGYTWRYI